MNRDVYRSLKDEIIACRLLPGELVTEGELSHRYDVGKAAVRKALSLLQEDGFVRILARQGVLVEPLGSADIRDTTLLRSFVEPTAAELAAPRATPADVERLSGHLERAIPAGADLDRPTAGQLREHSNFHVEIAALSGIPKLIPIVRSLLDEVERFMNLSNHHGDPVSLGQGDRAVLDAIRAGDAIRAAQSARQELIDSRRLLVASLRAGFDLEDPAPEALGRRP